MELEICSCNPGRPLAEEFALKLHRSKPKQLLPILPNWQPDPLHGRRFQVPPEGMQFIDTSAAQLDW
jgi:hypothetical protein